MIDPEIEDRNEKFSTAMMGAASGQIIGLVAFFIGLVAGLMSDQQTGLINVGLGMAVFTFFSLIHYGISFKWTGISTRHTLQDGLVFLLPAFLGGILYFYATFANTDWSILGYVGGFLFLLLLGKGILFLENTPPRSRKTTYIFSPFDAHALLIIVLVGSILGVGVGMGSQGHRAIGRGVFARTFLEEKILGSRFQADLLLFGMPHSYRLIQALTKAHENGLPIRVLVTQDASSRYRNEIATLVSQKVPFRILPNALPSYIHPMALFDRRILLYGSGGWGSYDKDGGSQMQMVANLLSIGRIHAAQKVFDSLWNQSKPPLFPSQLSKTPS